MSVYSGTVNPRSVHPASPVLLRWFQAVTPPVRLELQALGQTGRVSTGPVRSISGHLSTHTFPHVTTATNSSPRDCPALGRPSIQVVSLSAPIRRPACNGPIRRSTRGLTPSHWQTDRLYHQKWPTRRSHSNAHRPIKRQGLPTHLKFENRARPFRPRVR